jgi:release factor glutamine methyltransferase
MAVTVGDALRRLGARLDRLDARLLVQHLSGLTHAELIARPETPLSDEQEGWLDLLATRRERGEPLAYLLGRAGFRQLELVVSPAVLVPRPETEVLVDWALEIGDRATLKKNEAVAAWSVLDLGTGSGAIPLSIKHERPSWAVSAVDLSPEALKVAQGNAERLALTVDFYQSDWYGNLPAALRVDCIVANPPYVADGDPHLSGDGLRFEPMMALTDYADGLSALRTIVGGAPAHLQTGGWLLMEHGYDQAAAVRGMLERDFDEITTRRDLAGIERVTGGRRKTTNHD